MGPRTFHAIREELGGFIRDRSAAAAILLVAPLKTRFIVNLRSGRAARALPQVAAFASAHGADVVLTERARHAGELAQRALDDGCTLIVAVGGDGTLNETAGALVGTGATFGLIPCGSGDGLGRHLKIHGPVPQALAVLEHGRPRAIDTGVADGHPFFTVAGLGFEAEIARRFNTLQRRGFLRYVTTIANTFRTWKPERFVITYPDGKDEVLAFTLAVANADQYGNQARVAPAARVDDGLLDLCAIPPVNGWNALPMLRRLFDGTMGHTPGAVLRRATRFQVERPGPGLLHTDGEVHAADATISFAIKPGSLRVMCPP